MRDFLFRRRLGQCKMADNPSAFGKVLQLQRSQQLQGGQKGNRLLWQHRWRPIFPFLRFKITASSTFRVQGGVGVGRGLTAAQQLPLANLLPDSVARRRWQPMRRPGDCVILREPVWNNQRQARTTVSMVTSLSNLTRPI